jgi:hypothetical protein
MIGNFVRVVAWPVRLLFRCFDWMGRAASVLLGFLLMVGGAALLAGPLFVIGAPLFLIGLFLTLRALG